MGGVTFSQLVGLIMMAYLARYLDASDFGYVAFAILAVELSRELVFIGVPDLLVRERRWNSALADSGFIIQIAFGVLLALIMVGLGQILTHAGEAEIGMAMMTLAVVFPIEAACAMPLARLRFDHRYRAIAIAQGAGALVMAGIAVISIRAGHDFMSIIYARIASASAITVVTMFSAGLHPRVRLRFGPLLQHRQSLAHIVGTRLLGILNVKVSDLVIGIMGGPALLGAYQLASRLLQSFLQTLLAPLQTVMLSSLRQLESTEEVGDWVSHTLQVISLIIFPITIGSMVVSPEIIRILYGESWENLVVPSAILLFALLPASLNYMVYPVSVSLNRSDLAFKFTIAVTVLSLILFLASAKFGLVAVAAAFTLRTIIGFLVSLFLFSTKLGLRIGPLLRGCALPAIGSCAIVAGVLMARTLLIIENDLLALFAYIITGVLSYGLVTAASAVRLWRSMSADRRNDASIIVRRSGSA